VDRAEEGGAAGAKPKLGRSPPPRHDAPLAPRRRKGSSTASASPADSAAVSPSASSRGGATFRADGGRSSLAAADRLADDELRRLASAGAGRAGFRASLHTKVEPEDGV